MATAVAYRRLLSSNRRLQSPQHKNRFFTEYTRYRTRKAAADPKSVPQTRRFAEDFYVWRQTIDNHTDLLEKHGYLIHQDQRLYIRRQATTVGLQVPLFWDEKPEKERLAEAEEGVNSLLKIKQLHAKQEQMLSTSSFNKSRNDDFSEVKETDSKETAEVEQQKKLFDAALNNPSFAKL